jgi:hypothetical protein
VVIIKVHAKWGILFIYWYKLRKKIKFYFLTKKKKTGSFYVFKFVFKIYMCENMSVRHVSYYNLFKVVYDKITFKNTIFVGKNS